MMKRIHKISTIVLFAGLLVASCGAQKSDNETNTTTELIDRDSVNCNNSPIDDSTQMSIKDGLFIGEEGAKSMSDDGVIITQDFAIKVNTLGSFDDFHEGLACIGHKGFIDKNGDVVISDQYKQVYPFNEGLAFFWKDNSNGFIDKNGNIAISLEYISENGRVGMWFKEGLAAVSRGKNGKWGYVNRTGNVVIPYNYQFAYPFNEGLARVWNDDKKEGYIDKNGNIAIPMKFNFASDFHEGYAAVNIDGKYGYIDKSGSTVIPMQFTYASDFSEGFAVVWDGDNAGYVNKNGNVVIPNQYVEAEAFSEGLAMVRENGKGYGFIDKKGSIVIPMQFDDAKSFNEGLAAVKKGEKWGYIDKNGNIIYSFLFDNARSFSEGLAVVSMNGRDGYIDRHGNTTIVETYIRMGEQRREEARVRQRREQAESDARRQEARNDVSWLYGAWRLETGGFIFWVKITENNLRYEALSYPGITDVLWDGNYTLYMNRIEVIKGTTLLRIDLDKKRIYTPKGEAFQKRR